MGDADRGALEQFQLRCAPDEDGVARERSDLFWIELIADRKHELKPFALRGPCSNRAKDVGQAIHKCSHRRIDERLSGQSFPWEIDFHATGTIVERPGMVEPRWPMRTFKVKFPRTLCDPGQLRDRGGWVVPVDIETDTLWIRVASQLGILFRHRGETVSQQREPNAPQRPRCSL